MRDPLAPRIITPSEAANLFNEEYYRSGCGPLAYERSDHWIGFFGGIAEHLIRSLKPARVLDAGCAMGFLVEAFWDRGVEAWGIDISPYAISNVRRDMKPFCRIASVNEPIQETFDLITCIEVLEHMMEDDARAAIGNLCAATGAILFSSSPNDFNEPTHFCVRPPLFWLKVFAEFGFYPDIGFDAGFVTPHAMLLRKNSAGISDDVLALYADHIRTKCVLHERQHSLSTLASKNSELVQQNAASLQSEEQARARIQSLTEQLESAAHRIAELSEFQAALERTNTADDGRDLEIEELRARQTELESTIRDLQDAFTEIGELQERTNTRLSETQIRATRALQGAQSILQSRVWRTLIWCGGLILNATAWSQRLRNSVRNGLLRTESTRHKSASELEIHVQCDAPNGPGPYTGDLEVRGWTVAKAGINGVEVEVRDLVAPVQARYGLYRPDVAKIHPGVLKADYSGFAAKLDMLALPEGPHDLIVRARDLNGLTFEIEKQIIIDHTNGYGGEYARYILQAERRNPGVIRTRLAQFKIKPLISIVVPVHKTDPDILARTIDSVRRQSYENWELCIVDDCSQSPAIDRLLARAANGDSRIKAGSLPENLGISGASNKALTMASGEYVALLDHDDELAQDALFYVLEAINKNPEADIFYSDEDHIDRSGTRSAPFFKPDWSPDLVLAENYVCHLMVFRRELALAVGGFRSEFDLSQDHDILLRMNRRSDKIVHIPRVLYHWRTEVEAEDINRASFRESEAFTSSRRVVEDYLKSANIPATVEEGRHPGRWRVRYSLPANPPSVSIIIPSGGNLGVLERNINALAGKTDYSNWEIVVIDNSKEKSIEGFSRDWQFAGRTIRYIDHRNQPFNFSVICNKAARSCESPLLLFLNDDTEIINDDWLTAMVEQANRPEVGAVGARLLFPDGRIQHAGVTMGVFGICGHAFKGLFGDERIYFDFPDLVRNVSAVTGACLMTRAEVFWAAGGFDEVDFPVAYNDIDLCLKIVDKGYRIIYTPHASLYHHEAFSKTIKDLDPRPEETQAFVNKWKHIIRYDPFYNPNLTNTAEDFSLRRFSIDT